MPDVPSPAAQDFECVELAIVALGRARLTMPELAAMRKAPPPGFAARFSTQLLKHSDEQTLAALTALGTALTESELEQEDFSRWAVISSSRYIGRSAFAAVIDKYRVEGPWGVSVQVIPHRSPHSVSGTISMALGNHGPCIGVGAGPDDEVHALASVAGALRRRQWAGAWVVLSAWTPELAIDRAGRPTSDSQCQAAALALVPTFSAGRFATDQRKHDVCDRAPLGHVRFGPLQNDAGCPLPSDAAGHAAGASPNLTDFLIAPDSAGRAWRCPFGGVLEVEVALAAHPRRTAEDGTPAAQNSEAPRRVPASASARGRSTAPNMLGGRV